MNFNFTLTFRGIDPTTPSSTDRLIQAECDDALVGMCGPWGFADFSRSGSHLGNVTSKAIRQLEKALKVNVLEYSVDHSTLARLNLVPPRLQTKRGCTPSPKSLM